MVTVAYSLSSQLKNTLAQIDTERAFILTTPIPPKAKIRMRWESTISRVFWSLSLSGHPYDKKTIEKLISTRGIILPSQTQLLKELTPDDHAVIKYKQALDYITQEWKASPSPITENTITTLNSIASNGKLVSSHQETQQFVTYLGSQREHPVIQAASACIQIMISEAFTRGNNRTARLLALLILYKYGYDLDQMVMFSDYFKRTHEQLRETTQLAKNTENITRWLEYFALAIANRCKILRQEILQPKPSSTLPNTYWELNSRQKAVITLLDQPGATFTNRQAQKLFNISQITASRDLSKLAMLGLVFVHGKGRSVYYSKV